MEMKICAACGADKPLSAYPRRSGGGRRGTCRACIRKRGRIDGNGESRDNGGHNDAAAGFEMAPEAEAPAALKAGGMTLVPGNAAAASAEADGTEGSGGESPLQPVGERVQPKRKRRHRKAKRAVAVLPVDAPADAGGISLDGDGDGDREDGLEAGRQRTAAADAGGERAGAGESEPEKAVIAASAEAAGESGPAKKKRKRKRRRKPAPAVLLAEEPERGDSDSTAGGQTASPDEPSVSGTGERAELSGAASPGHAAQAETHDAGLPAPGSREQEQKQENPRKRKRKRRRKRKATVHILPPGGGETAPPAKPPYKRIVPLKGPFSFDPAKLNDRGTGMIRLRGRRETGKRWSTEIPTEMAVRMVAEGAAGIINPGLIHKLYTKTDFRLLILQRDHYICRYCGRFGDTIDHVLPKSKGGLSTPDNCVCACADCNLKKADSLDFVFDDL
ncbi:HNH endonuclease [Paenibacillus humicola]|uniref:HNH endonuclease n=1 Tax=Paenibacillus humicola TaxID=3110540 RepID=UPI00237BE16C|nr:HNH endonuclease signature motif containing protein [Paenibacillus humicola]